MLGGRKITAMLAGETLEGSVARGCLQGGVLLPVLWSLGGRTHRRTQWEWLYTLLYADDTATLISGKYPNTI